LNGQLKVIASKKQISLPTGINNDQKNDIMKLGRKKHKDVDIAFSEEAVSKGKEAVNMFDRCSKECSDPDIKTWFTTALPELRKHLEEAMTANDKLKKMK
jgi:putative membrane protein